MAIHYQRDFDGTPVEVGTWNVTGDTITLTAWVNSANEQSDPRIVVKGADTSDQTWALIWSKFGGSPDKFQMRVTTTSTKQTVTGATTITSGNRYFVVGVYDGTDIKVYLDGVQDGTVAASPSGDIASNSQQVWLGDNPPTTDQRPFHGCMEDIRVYDRALSPAEILTMFNSQGHDGIVDNLSGRWNQNALDSGTTVPTATDTVKDASVNGRDGTRVETVELPRYEISELSFRRRVT